MTVRGKRILALAAVIGVAGAALAQAGMRLLVNGRVASTDVLVINGRTYVPLDDMARALGLTVRQNGNDFEVASPGTPATPAVTVPVTPQAPPTTPATPTAPAPPAVTVPATPTVTVPSGAATGPGVTVATGALSRSATVDGWRFETRKISFTDRYNEQYLQPHQTLQPLAPTDTLVALTCRLTNRERRRQTPLLMLSSAGDTALAGIDGRTYAPIAYDARQASEKLAGDPSLALPPGSYQDFVLVFSVPKGAQLRELVFKVGTYPDDLTTKGTDVRVALPT